MTWEGVMEAVLGVAKQGGWLGVIGAVLIALLGGGSLIGIGIWKKKKKMERDEAEARSNAGSMGPTDNDNINEGRNRRDDWLG